MITVIAKMMMIMVIVMTIVDDIDDDNSDDACMHWMTSSIYLSIYFIYLYIHLSIYLSIYLSVSKKAGKEHLSLLDDGSSSAVEEEAAVPRPGLWGSLTSLLQNKVTTTPESAADDRIHVFSLATGW